MSSQGGPRGPRGLRGPRDIINGDHGDIYRRISADFNADFLAPLRRPGNG